MAVNYSKYTTKQLEAMKKANSSDWHTAGTQAERDALHKANQEINKILDSRNGTSSSFDSGTGKWTTSGGSSSSKGSSSSSSSGRGSSSSSGSSGSTIKGGYSTGTGSNIGVSSGGGSSTPDYLKGLVTTPQQPAAGGNNPWSTGLDDNGETDYSVLLNNLLSQKVDTTNMGAMQSAYQAVLDAQTKRNAKIEQNPDLAQYANAGGINSRASAYLEWLSQSMATQQQLNQYDAQLQGMIGSAPEYMPSEWEQTRDALAKAALEMNYGDWLKSDQYSALAGRYGQQGDMAMRDILAQMSARTGGLASSFAQTAAQQQYNQYMSQLEQAAREMYAGERSDALQNAQLAGEFSDKDYNRYLDRLAQYNNDRSFGFDILSQVLQNSRYDREWQNSLEQQAYQRQQDALSRGDYDRQSATDRINSHFQGGGAIEDLPQELIQQSGLSQPELLARWTYFDDLRKREQAEWDLDMAKKQNSLYSSGSKGSGSGGSINGTPDYDGLFREAIGQVSPENFIGDSRNYKKYGFANKNGLMDAYKDWYDREGYQYAITDISQLGDTAMRILESASRSYGSVASIADMVARAKEANTISDEEAAFIMSAIGQ